ncbi:hypothetical protein EC973_006575 [Apophysomyces ossiformis]|uniref:Uncharacterized protein n=1 Tax=Apophysomyces ossiformis TaxID=679940 RepID=A0A8H7ERK8_9FUNG|nr:hypothetical protein EC973_006575 [Apophysomyces ossiformis]
MGCPVCHDPIPLKEWSKFVPKSVVDHYNKFNQPYRSFSRCCPNCETEVSPCNYSLRRPHPRCGGQSLLTSPYSRPQLISKMVEELLDSCQKYSHYDDSMHIAMLHLLPIFSNEEWTNDSLPELYQHAMSLIIQFETQHLGRLIANNACMISKEMVYLDMSPETWKQIQFLHIAFFPNVDW